MKNDNLEQLIKNTGDMENLVSALATLRFDYFDCTESITVDNLNALSGLVKALQVQARINSNLGSALFVGDGEVDQ